MNPDEIQIYIQLAHDHRKVPWLQHQMPSNYGLHNANKVALTSSGSYLHSWHSMGPDLCGNKKVTDLHFLLDPYVMRLSGSNCVYILVLSGKANIPEPMSSRAP